ncbi:MAG TPA: hypothetical protein VK464_14135, partial [Symbiobacteriaceae bacterium]|nr:hypothetical protein [Symbiobacteriaceae bacterium]
MRRLMLTAALLLLAGCTLPWNQPRLTATKVKLAGPVATPDDPGTYILEVATGKAWQVNVSPYIKLTWTRDSRTVAISHDLYEGKVDLIDLPPDQTALRLTGRNIQEAAISPDGRQVAFADGSQGVMVARRDGSRLRSFAPTNWVAEIQWAPDSRRFLFRSGSELTPAFVVDVAAGTWAPPGNVRLGSMAWAPDGKRVALGVLEKVSVIPVTGEGERIEIPWTTWHLQWAPDGSHLLSAVKNYGTPGYTLLVAPVHEGAKPVAVADAGRVADWAPDSSQIVYVSNGCHSGEFDLYTVRPDGSERRRLTTTPQVIKSSPLWAPDGKRIAYVDTENLMLLDAGTGEARVL